jgi:predicted XRE-type DNA-binding protein
MDNGESMRLKRAREYLIIAESANAKREAYRHAAEEIAAHIEETNDSQAKVARNLQVTPTTVSKLLKWRKSDYEAQTPFTMDEQAGTRSARSHAKNILRHPEQRRTTLDELGDDDLEGIEEDARTARVNRRTRSHRPKEKRRIRNGVYNDLEFELIQARNRLRNALLLTRHDTIDDEEHVEALMGQIANIRNTLELISIAIVGETDIDWDSELANLTDTEQ